jgi:hypothetical protein
MEKRQLNCLKHNMIKKSISTMVNCFQGENDFTQNIAMRLYKCSFSEENVIVYWNCHDKCPSER